MNIAIIFVVAIVALGVGFFAGRYLFKKNLTKLREEAQEEADRIIKDAKQEGENEKQNKLLEAKEQYLKQQSDLEKESNERNNKLSEREKQVKQREDDVAKREESIEKKEKDIEDLRNDLTNQKQRAVAKQEEMDKKIKEHTRKLEEIANLNSEEAKQELIQNLEEEARTESMAHVKQIKDEAKLKANKEAKKIIIQTIQRTAAEHTIENTVSVFNLKSDDVKGQIIGREGRNIRSLEAATGVEFIVDDTPEAIIISGYDPVRREVARLSLQRLVADGRIHPSRIEEVVEKTKKEMEDHIVEVGERTVIEMGIHGLHSELIRMVGRMRFRSSYGQNLLQHSKEVARLCATMAAELGLNAKLAKRAGLLHDLGKVPEEETEIPHAILSMNLCEKYGEHEAVCNAVGAHHDEVDMNYLISPVVQVCDAISGARPGARSEMVESYLQRISDLENVAMSYEGVIKAFAMQAGRELRVIVESEKVADDKADELAFRISEHIQKEMQYPGQIRVTVIRERRAVSYAK